jgi:DNA-binding beta-propeller fold protein YncE
VYVSDAERDVVDFYDPEGRYLASVGASGSGLGQMTLPAGVAVAERHLFVADSYNRRVLVYELVGDPG